MITNREAILSKHSKIVKGLYYEKNTHSTGVERALQNE